MAINYFKPQEVVYPKDYVDGVEEKYDGTRLGEKEQFSIAELTWNGHKSYGIRWNLTMREADNPIKRSGKKKCLGIPVSFTHPVWFILPEKLEPYIKQFLDSQN